MKYEINDPRLVLMRPGDAVGDIVGNFEILDHVSGGMVKTKCLLCGEGISVIQWSRIKNGQRSSCGCKHKLKNPEQYIGNKRYKLTLLEINGVDKYGHVMGLFRCDCGNTTTKTLSRFLGGGVMSCGCAAKIVNPKQYIGNTYHKLTIINITESSTDGPVFVTCKCDCGNIKDIKLSSILANKIKSCGCGHLVSTPELNIGKKYKHLTMIDIVPHKGKRGHALGKFKCYCGNICVKEIAHVRSGKIGSCGCDSTPRDGLCSKANKRAYNVWYKMMSRCYMSGNYVTKNKLLKFLMRDYPDNNYFRYGARGITVCREWHDLNNFVKWYNSNIKKGESIDRIDNNSGYHPDNTRSANNTIQTINTRVRADNASGFKGVHKLKREGCWMWYLTYKKEPHRQQGYSNKYSALLDRNMYISLRGYPHKIQVPNNTEKISISKSPDGSTYVLYIIIKDDNNTLTTYYGQVGSIDKKSSSIR